MSGVVGWCIFMALIVLFFTVLVLMAMDDEDDDWGRLDGDLDITPDDRPGQDGDAG